MTGTGLHDVGSRSAVRPRTATRYDGWWGLLAVVLSRAYVAFFLALSAMAVVPAVGPWDSYLVRSGSMAPNIRAGDVVVAAPFDTTRPVPLGRVMVFTDPTRSANAGHEVLLVHRVVNDNKNGTYTTQGDANRAQDGEPLTAQSIRGQGRILVRFVGLPWLWASAGSWMAFALWLLVTLAALWVVVTSVIRSDRSTGPTDPTVAGGAGPDGGDRGTPRPATAALPPAPSWTVPRWWTGIKVTSLLGLSVVVIAATMLAPQSASGRFTAETLSAGNTWTSAVFGTAQVTYPVSTRTYGANWTGMVTGTAAAAAGKILSSVSLTIQDVTDGSYWNGTGWIGDPSPAPLPKVLTAGTTVWSYALSASALSPGDDYAVFATAVDSASVPFTSPTVTWTYDNTTPAVAVTYPVSAGVYGSLWTGALTGTASTTSLNVTLAAVTLAVKDTTTSRWWNGAAFVATSETWVTATGTSSWSSPMALASLSDGHSYTVTSMVTDSGGNTQTSAATSFSVDATAPTASVTYPVTATRYGPNWTGTITGTASDNRAVASVVLTIADVTNHTWWNGAAWQAITTTVPASGAATWTYPMAISHLTDQHAYTIVATATDAVGNVGTSSTVTVSTDISAGLPVTVAYPVTGTVYGANWSGVLTGTASDPSGDLAGVSVEIKDTTAGTWWNGSTWQPTLTTRPVTGTSIWSYPLAAATLTSEHNYSVRAVATDLVGNTGAATATFGYLTSGAIVSVAYPANAATYGTNWAGSLSGTVTATGGLTITRVTLAVRNTTNGTYWNGTSWQVGSTTVTASGTTSWSAPLAAVQLISGSSYSVTATAVDNLSNSHAVTVPWSYVTTPPSVVITYPSVGGTYGSAWGGAISGTAVANAAGFSIAAGTTSIAVRDTTTGLWWNGTSFAAAAQTTVTTTGSTSWTYALPSSAMTSSHAYSATATATDSGGNVATSAAVSWTYFVATKLVITTQPSSVIANAPMSPAVSVAVQDAAGHVATTDSSTTVTLAIGTNPGSATLTGGGPVTVVAGVATFRTVALSKVGTGYTLNALSTGLTSTTSTTFNVTIGTASKLTFTRQPSSTAWSGSSFSVQPTVAVQDAYGNTVTTSSYSVTLTTSGGTLSCGSNPRTTSSGVATYSSCKITGQGTFTLTATASGLTSTTSTPVVVSYRTVAAPTNVVAVAGSTVGTTRVTFSASNPTTGVSSYTCYVYVNTGRTSTPVKGALITSATCSASGTTVTVGATNSGANSIVVVVRANPKTNYVAADSTAVVGSAA